jgi:hypothetical protein
MLRNLTFLLCFFGRRRRQLFSVARRGLRRIDWRRQDPHPERSFEVKQRLERTHSFVSLSSNLFPAKET